MLKKLTHEEARAVVLRLFEKRAPRPVLIGEVALALGHRWSLADAESLITSMGVDKLIRPATREEKARFDVRNGWVLV